MESAAFVLAGGRSSRMGRDKALLPFKGRVLVDHVASEARAITGNVSLVGDTARYSYLGYPMVEDIYSGCGPLSGIHAALTASRAEWNLIVACDMPEVNAEFLGSLMERARSGRADAVLPAGPGGVPEPLCAVYRRRAVDVIALALANGIRKVTDGLAGLEVDLWRVPHSYHFLNLNNPREWASYSNH
jgi:molybdopterin-guanine dinucleotide biosynthesis protein A